MSPIEEPSKSKLPKPPKPPPGPAPVANGPEPLSYCVRLGDFLEARLGLLVVRVGVGVVPTREFAVGLLDLLGRRFLLDAERLVVVGSCCHLARPS
jgi:hypothetical protein